MQRTQLLQPLIAFYQSHKRMPSYSEMTQIFGVPSKNTVGELVAKLTARGLIAKDERGKLLPTRYFHEVRLLGAVEAGFPSPAEEELGDAMDLNEFLIENKEATYMLKVTGDSMIGAGILPG